MTRSPRISGEAVRPPWVVTSPSSSGSERFQRTLPSAASRALNSPPRVKKKTVFGVGVDRGRRPADAAGRRIGVVDVSAASPRAVLRFRHRAPPVVPGGSPDRRRRAAGRGRSPRITGVERPPYAALNSRFSPSGDQDSGSPVSGDRPSRAGPRISGQSHARAEAVNRYAATPTAIVAGPRRAVPETHGGTGV